MSTSHAEQPGKTWVVCEDEDGAFNITIVLGFGVIFLLVAFAILCGLKGACRRRRNQDEFVEVISEVESESFRPQSGAQSQEKEETDTGLCMNCLLIEMGEMVCYSDRCPDCGRVPPGRNIKQQLAVKKTVSKWKRNVKPVPTSAETLQQNGDNCQSKNKKDSVVISKKSLHPPPGPAPRNLNVRNNGAAASMQQNYFKRDFV